MRLLVASFLACLSLVPVARADITIGNRTKVSFATAAQGAALLAEKDDFTKALGAFDRQARLKTDKDVTEQAYLDFVAKAATEWPAADRAKVQEALEAIAPKLEILGLPLPEKVLIVRTTGDEEAKAPYSRGAAIFLPAAELERSPGLLQGTIAHEFFHVLSRANPELRDRAYAAIGFIKCNEVAFPPALVARKITNPDAPNNDHYIKLTLEDKPIFAVPVLVSRTDKYSVREGGEIFNYAIFKWLVVDKLEDGSVTPHPVGNELQLLDMQQIRGFYEQAGRNTNYTIHPEEVLAENFKLMIMGAQGVTSSEVLTRLRAALAEPAKPRN